MTVFNALRGALPRIAVVAGSTGAALVFAGNSDFLAVRPLIKTCHAPAPSPNGGTHRDRYNQRCMLVRTSNPSGTGMQKSIHDRMCRQGVRMQRLPPHCRRQR